MGINWVLDISEGIDFAIFLLGVHEKHTVATYRKLLQKGGVAIDIGANIGSHTLHLADIVGERGKVVAVEPTKFAFAKLTRNLEVNPTLSARVSAIQAMLGEDEDGTVPDTLPSSWPLDQSGDIHPLLGSSEKSTDGAILTTVDTIVEREGLDRIDLIKLDVDGFEVAVLRGAKKTLARLKPRFVMELQEYTLRERGYSLEELVSIFRDLGYVFFDDTLQHRLPDSLDELRAMMPDGASLNAVLLPASDPLVTA